MAASLASDVPDKLLVDLHVQYIQSLDTVSSRSPLSAHLALADSFNSTTETTRSRLLLYRTPAHEWHLLGPHRARFDGTEGRLAQGGDAGMGHELLE